MTLLSILREIVYYLLKGLRPNGNKFYDENSLYWKQQYASAKEPKGRYICVLNEAYPLILVGNVHISSMIAIERGLKLLTVIPSHLNVTMVKELKSFGNIEFIYEDRPKLVLAKLVGFYEAFKAVLSFKTPEDILSYELDDIRFGDLIYDSYLSYGYATMRKVISYELFKTLYHFYYARRLAFFIKNNYDVEVVLASHMCNCIGGTIARYFVKNNTEIWERWVTLKKYKSVETLYDSAARPDIKYVNYMKRNRSKFIPLAEQHLKDRLASKTDDYGAQLPYQKDKRVYNSKLEFCDAYNLSVNKKIVFVMMHAFNDYPNAFGFSIYRDYYQWFEALLNLAKEVDSVNWIFKEHPGAEYYPTKDVDLMTLFSQINADNIRFIEGGANFNTSSLRNIADGICTCIGTAGLEYSTYGIPCVLGGKSWYAGFGFTIEPTNVNEFVNIIKNIETIGRLDDDQTDMAKIIAFLTFEIFDVTRFPDPFGTIASFDVDAQRVMSAEQIFAAILEKRINSTSDEKDKYNESIKEFINSPNYTQFIDFDRYPEFRI